VLLSLIMGAGSPGQQQPATGDPPVVKAVKVEHDRETGRYRVVVLGTHLDGTVSVHMRVGGHGGPGRMRFELTESTPSRVAFLQNEGSDYRILPREPHTCIVCVECLGKELHRLTGRWRAGDHGPIWEDAPSGPPPADVLAGILQTSSRGTIRLAGARYTFVYVPVQASYRIGLTQAQRDDGFLLANGFAEAASPPGGTVEIPLAHPFLIQETEVTNAQFIPFLKATGGGQGQPPGRLVALLRSGDADALARVGRLPVVGVSAREAARFAAWLGTALEAVAPGWEIRLPHEIEWEMAARGTDERSYAFPECAGKRAIESLRTQTPRPVGSNPLDKSPFGVLDLTGNVGELTATVYETGYLTKLAEAREAGRFEAWDPRRPFAANGRIGRAPEEPYRSFNVCVRGGAFGEPPVLAQVSVRRQQECGTPDPQVGFRLVLIPKEDVR
jgi:formylglycine-generating enzyme required for sulfatase activity